MCTSARQTQCKDPIEEVPNNYVQEIICQTGTHDPKYSELQPSHCLCSTLSSASINTYLPIPDSTYTEKSPALALVCQRYDEDYPIVNPNATTDWDRRGKPHGHDTSGMPMWNKDEVPQGIKMENMTLAKLYPTTSTPNAPWQAPCADTCAAKRAASDGRHAHGGDGDGSSPYSRSGYYTAHTAQTPYEAAPSSSSGGGGSSSSCVRIRNDWQNAVDACAAKRGMNSSAD